MPDAVHGHSVSADSSPPPPKVLVVDDQRSVASALSKVIRRAGFDAIPCHCAGDAMAYMDHEQAPSAAVIDIHLPDMNGLILAQKLRTAMGPEAPIIVVSGDTSMETIRSLAHVGATYFFPKPVNSAALLDRLKELTR